MQISLRTSDKVVVQRGNSLGERDDCTIEEITDEQAAALMQVLSQPNGGVTFDGETFTALPEPEPQPDPLAAVKAIALDPSKSAAARIDALLKINGLA